jgi:transcriptional regulator with XRE-family HTH domain
MSDDTTTTPRDHMPTQHLITLADLIRQHQDRTGESYSDIARRAGCSKAKIGQLANIHQNHMPRADTLERISTGLGLPLRVIQQAALASAGIMPQEYDAAQRVDFLAGVLRDFSEDDLETCAAIIMALKERRDKETRPVKPIFKPAPAPPGPPPYRQKNRT